MDIITLLFKEVITKGFKVILDKELWDIISLVVRVVKVAPITLVAIIFMDTMVNKGAKDIIVMDIERNIFFLLI